MWIWITTALLLAGLLYWLLVITEGVYLGRRVVVWLYDITAHRYDGIKEFEPEWEQFFISQPLLHLLQNIPAPLALDVATGTGRVPLVLLEEPTFHGRIVGVDASARMLAQAAQKLRPFGPRVALIQQTADRLPFAAATFDAVTCLEALEFFPSDEDALREMVRVLRPGGVLLLTRRRGWEGKSFLGRYRSAASFTHLLAGLGLTDIVVEPWQIDYEQIFARKPASNQ